MTSLNCHSCDVSCSSSKSPFDMFSVWSRSVVEIPNALMGSPASAATKIPALVMVFVM